MMAMPVGQCPTCGVEKTAHQMLAEEILVGIENPEVNGVNRIFIARCDEHGEFRIDRPNGHHTTIGEKEFRATFRREIASRMSSLEKVKFDKAWEGKYRPTEEELERWRKI
jgi:hypothetical protein